MTRFLQIIFLLTLGLIMIFWIVDLIEGASAMVSDQAIMEGWLEDNERYENEKYDYRLRTLIYALPTLVLTGLIILSIRRNNNLLFYWTFLVGLTLFQIIPIVGLFSEKAEEPSFIKPILFFLTTLFATGQIFSVYKVVRLRKMTS